MQTGLVHAQQFSGSWPGVLDEMLEYLALSQLSFGRGRPAQVQVMLSRHRVAADQLQPHVNRFREQLAQQLPGARLALRAVPDAELHRVEVRFDG